MTAIVTFLILLGFATLCGFVAAHKRRSIGAWMAFGFCCPLLACLGLYLASRLPISRIGNPLAGWS